MSDYRRKQEVFFSFIIWLVLNPYLVAHLLMIFLVGKMVIIQLMDAHPGSQNLCEKNSSGARFRLSHYYVVYGSLQVVGLTWLYEVRWKPSTVNRYSSLWWSKLSKGAVSTIYYSTKPSLRKSSSHTW